MNETITYYNQNAEEYFNKTVNVSMQESYDQFEAYLKPGDKILDLGCGRGRDFRYFLSKGYDVVPVDESKEMCRLAEKYIGRDVCNITFAELDYNNEFDAVWACASLRLVNSRNNLREKVYIFDQGLDDRIIELMKLFIRFDISQKNPEHEVDEIFLEIRDDAPTRFAICLTDGQWGSVPFNQEVYDRIKEEMIDPEDNGKQDYIVNMQWAGECIHNMTEKLNE